MNLLFIYCLRLTSCFQSLVLLSLMLHFFRPLSRSAHAHRPLPIFHPSPSFCLPFLHFLSYGHSSCILPPPPPRHPFFPTFCMPYSSNPPGTSTLPFPKPLLYIIHLTQYFTPIPTTQYQFSSQYPHSPPPQSSRATHPRPRPRIPLSISDPKHYSDPTFRPHPPPTPSVLCSPAIQLHQTVIREPMKPGSQFPSFGRAAAIGWQMGRPHCPEPRYRSDTDSATNATKAFPYDLQPAATVTVSGS